MKKLILVIVCIAPLSLFAQHLQLKDLFYIYEHSKSECDSYLAQRDFIIVSLDDLKADNGCYNYAWMYKELKPSNEAINKVCSDGLKGNVRYFTFSRKVYDDLLQQYKDHGFTHFTTYKDENGQNFDLCKWFNCIGYFSIRESEQGTFYTIGLEHFRDKE